MSRGSVGKVLRLWGVPWVLVELLVHVGGGEVIIACGIEVWRSLLIWNR